MRIVFMGTAEFGIPSLKILLDNQYSIVSVVTLADKHAGRGQQLSTSPIKKFAIEHQLQILQPTHLREKSFIENLKALRADIFIVVAFRILPPDIFTIPRFGAVNLHASLLPKYRGAAPINWAIINGETETGVTTFFLLEQVDTGNIILQARVPIGENEIAGELHDRLAQIGAEIVLHSVRLIEQGKATPTPQNNSMATSAPKLFKEHCKIDWEKPPREVHNFIRGLSPKPCAYTFHHDTMLKIYRTAISTFPQRGQTGEIVKADEKLIVSTGEGAVEILEIQKEGRKILTSGEFLRGYSLRVGDKFS